MFAIVTQAAEAGATGAVGRRSGAGAVVRVAARHRLAAFALRLTDADGGSRTGRRTAA